MMARGERRTLPVNEIINPQDYKNAADIPRELIIQEDGFDIKIRRSSTEFCIVEDIEVNGHNVYFFDIGTVKDLDPDNAPACGCGNRQFVAKTPTTDVLNELEMDAAEFDRLMVVLKKYLSVGYCKRCR